jgi:hypothetical protein
VRETSWAMSEREERIARNEASAREINEGIEEAQPRSAEDEFRIVCECGQRGCTRLIAISIPEYEAIRSDPTLFAVVKGHDLPDVEEVVRGTDRFSVVRKRRGIPAEIAVEEDPRD